MESNKPNPIDATRISFRLQAEVAVILAEQAAQADKSPNLIARDIVTASLLKPDDQRLELEMLHTELVRIRNSMSATNEIQEQLKSLSAEMGRIRDNLTAAKEQQCGFEAVSKELIGVCNTLRAADEQRQRFLDTFSKEFAAVRSTIPTSDKQQQALVTLCDEVVSISAETQQIRKLRGDLATSVNILLSNAGKLTPEQAKTWVQQTLLSHCK